MSKFLRTMESLSKRPSDFKKFPEPGSLVAIDDQATKDIWNRIEASPEDTQETQSSTVPVSNTVPVSGTVVERGTVVETGSTLRK